jgi:hypothetical protein
MLAGQLPLFGCATGCDTISQSMPAGRPKWPKEAAQTSPISESGGDTAGHPASSSGNERSETAASRAPAGRLKLPVCVVQAAGAVSESNRPSEYMLSNHVSKLGVSKLGIDRPNSGIFEPSPRAAQQARRPAAMISSAPARRLNFIPSIQWPERAKILKNIYEGPAKLAIERDGCFVADSPLRTRGGPRTRTSLI